LLFPRLNYFWCIDWRGEWWRYCFELRNSARRVAFRSTRFRRVGRRRAILGNSCEFLSVGGRRAWRKVILGNA